MHRSRALLVLVALASGCNAVFGVEDTVLTYENPRHLVFDNSASAIDLVDFSALVRLDETRIDYAVVRDPTTDLRFSDPVTGDDLAFDVDHWDPSGVSTVWVKIPKLEARSTSEEILMYYGQAAHGQAQPGEVWSAYALVFHGEADLAASSVNNYSATLVQATTGMGLVGDAVQFTGTGAHSVQFANSAELFDGWDHFTLELWVCPNYATSVVPGGSARVLSNGGTVANGVLEHEPGVASELKSSLDWRFTNGTSQLVTYLPLQTWSHLAYTYDGHTLWLYDNGAFADVDASPDPPPTALRPNTNQLTLGGASGTLDGMLDEVRVSTVYHEADWFNAEYLSMTDRLATFVRPGTER